MPWNVFRPHHALVLVALVLLLTACPGAGAPSGAVGADAGADRTVAVGADVELDGSGSSGPSGATLLYAWSFEDVPDGSAAALTGASTAAAAFTPDVAGEYRVRLTVRAGTSSDSDTVRVTAATLLEPGAVVDTPDGVRIAAVAGAIEAPVVVAVPPTDAPFAEWPLPAGVEAIGPAFRVSSDADLFVTGGAPLVLGVPVPDGVATDELALAVLSPPDPLDDGDGAGFVWSLLPGTFDPETGLLAVALGALTVEGRVVVPVTAVGFDSEATAGAAIGPSSVQFVDGFVVRCVGFAAGECTAADRTSTEEALDEVHAAWVDGLGFEEPRLVRRVEILTWLPPSVRVHEYQYQLRRHTLAECQNQNARGRYLRGESQAYTCYDPALTAPAHRTTRHEFFHALQYGFPTYLQNRSSVPEAVAEGMARSAEMSQNGLQRSFPRGLREVDVPLFDGDQRQYHAQDFWLYLMIRFGADLEALIPILRDGGTIDVIDDVLQTHAGYPENLTLGEAYWAWAKNQAFEKAVDLDRGVLGTPCTLNDGVTQPGGGASSVATPTVVTHLINVGPQSIPVSLPPLTSQIVELDFETYPAADYRARASVPFGAGLEVKYYDAADAGTTDCVGGPEPHVLNVSVTRGSSATHYVLVTNAHPTQSLSTTLTLAPRPQLTIVAPAEADRSFAEGASVSFRALVTGADAATPPVAWTYRIGASGSDVPMGTVAAGQNLVVDGLPCEALLIRASTTVDGELLERAIAVSCVESEGSRFFNAVPALSGSVGADGEVLLASDSTLLYVGDTAENVGVRTMLQFPLNLPDAPLTIPNATLSFTIADIEGFPYSVLGDLRAYRTDYGGSVDAGDYLSFGLPGAARLPFDGTTVPGLFDADVTALVNEAYAARATYGDQVQMILYFVIATDGDDGADRIAIHAQDLPGTYLLPALTVEYELE